VEVLTDYGPLILGLILLCTPIFVGVLFYILKDWESAYDHLEFNRNETSRFDL
jgi:hypothetical protein